MKHLNRKTLLPIVLSLALVIGACSAAETTSCATTSTSTAAQTLAENAAVEEVADTSGQPQETITLSGSTATSTSDTVTVDGGTVTITAAGTYRISGTLTDGQVVVDVPGDGWSPSSWTAPTSPTPADPRWSSTTRRPRWCSWRTGRRTR
ncbi:MAG TPA: carbohydrate-binding domain-containing protein [Nakamurella sp.]|jgi:hypothetical protein